MAPTRLLLTRAGPCSDAARTPITVSELKLSTLAYDSLINGEFNISEDIENGWEVKITMHKCVDIRNLESCDFSRSFYVVKNGCSEDVENAQTYSNMFFHFAHPELKCPIKAGRYKLTDFPFFIEDNQLVVSESKISTSVFGYLFRLGGYTKIRREIMCVDALLQLLYTRKHNWVMEKIQMKDIKGTTFSLPPVTGEGD